MERDTMQHLPYFPGWPIYLIVRCLLTKEAKSNESEITV